MTKIVWISDCHLSGTGVEILHQNTDHAFSDAIPLLRQACIDASLLICTGDISHHGDEAGYTLFDAVMGQLAQETGLPEVLCVPGNHDKRPEMTKILGLPFIPGTEFIQFSRLVSDTLLLGLDTMCPDKVSGELCNTRLGWVDDQLKRFRVRQALIFLHHPHR